MTEVGIYILSQLQSLLSFEHPLVRMEIRLRHENPEVQRQLCFHTCRKSWEGKTR